MTLKDVMTPGVEVISPDATLQQAAANMRCLNIGPLPVCGCAGTAPGAVAGGSATSGSAHWSGPPSRRHDLHRRPDPG
jgi:hypothetical protein